MSDGGRVKPPQGQAPPKVEGQEPQEAAGPERPRGFDTIHDERTQAIEGVRFRLSGGTQGTAPAGHLASERRAVIGAAAARIMRKASGPAGGGQVPNGSGSPLPADVKARMEPKLGADLSAVRLHTGSDSAHAATNFGARAFTVGNDIHFNDGQFKPGSKDGDKLLAHELTHVVQGSESHRAVMRAEDPAKKKEKAIADIKAATSRFPLMRCVECADALRAILKKAGINGKVVTLTNKPKNKNGFIYSTVAKTNISASNFHVGVEVDGIVYDNIHKGGIARGAWLADFSHMLNPAGGAGAFDITEEAF